MFKLKTDRNWVRVAGNRLNVGKLDKSIASVKPDVLADPGEARGCSTNTFVIN